MNFLKTFAVLLIEIFLFTNCEDSEEAQFEHQIVCKWNWIESFGGYAGNLITPESEGYSKMIIFDINK